MYANLKNYRHQNSIFRLREQKKSEERKILTNKKKPAEPGRNSDFIVCSLFMANTLRILFIQIHFRWQMKADGARAQQIPPHRIDGRVKAK